MDAIPGTTAVPLAPKADFQINPDIPPNQSIYINNLNEKVLYLVKYEEIE